MGFFSGLTDIVDPGGYFDSFSGKDAADASKQAGQLQYQATQEGIDLQRESRDLARSDLQPWRQAGQNSLDNMQRLANGPSSQGYLNLLLQDSQERPNWAGGLYGLANTRYQDLPGFTDASDAMSRQVQNSAVARGKLGSGNTLNDLFKNNALLGEQMRGQRFNEGLQLANFDTQNRNDAYSRRFNTESFGKNERDTAFNNHYNIASMGQNAAAMQCNNSLNSTNGITNLLTQGANAQAAGQVGAANAQSQGTNNLLNLAALIYSSDRRLKTGIVKIGESKGLGVYRFRYTFAPESEVIGYMADEVEALYPDAVLEIGGYKAVNYGAI